MTCHNFNVGLVQSAVEVRAWMINYISEITMNIVTHTEYDYLPMPYVTGFLVGIDLLYHNSYI